MKPPCVLRVILWSEVDRGHQGSFITRGSTTLALDPQVWQHREEVLSCPAQVGVLTGGQVWHYSLCNMTNTYLLSFPGYFQEPHWLSMATIFQTFFSNVFSWMKMYEFHLKVWLKFVPKVPVNNIPALVQIMAWRHLGDKPLSEPMMVSLLTHICVTRPQWVNLFVSLPIQLADQAVKW